MFLLFLLSVKDMNLVNPEVKQVCFRRNLLIKNHGSEAQMRRYGKLVCKTLVVFLKSALPLSSKTKICVEMITTHANKILSVFCLLCYKEPW